MWRKSCRESTWVMCAILNTRIASPNRRTMEDGARGTVMDKALERSNKERVLRQLSAMLREPGFQRTKPSFFTRPQPLVIEFVHLHKYKSGPDFRVHLGLRVRNDPFEAAALNGPDSHGRGYDFRFDVEPETVERCASEIARYVTDVAEPWFLSWRNASKLLVSPDSPLHRDAKEGLKREIESGLDAERAERTRALLGCM